MVREVQYAGVAKMESLCGTKCYAMLVQGCEYRKTPKLGPALPTHIFLQEHQAS